MAQEATLTLNRRQRRAVTALLSCRTHSEAATLAAVSRSQLQRWLRDDPIFVAALRAAEADMLSGVTRRLLSLAERACVALDSVLTATSSTDANRLAACRIVLDSLLRIREHHELSQRLDALESATLPERTW
jgi:hypothetical protein